MRQVKFHISPVLWHVLPWCRYYSNLELQGSLNLIGVGSMCPTSRCLVTPTWSCCWRHYKWFRTTHNAQCEDPSNWNPRSTPYPLRNHRILSDRFFPLDKASYHQWGRSQEWNIALMVLDEFCGWAKSMKRWVFSVAREMISLAQLTYTAALFVKRIETTFSLPNSDGIIPLNLLWDRSSMSIASILYSHGKRVSIDH